jgi:two-component system, NarL family, nitrate/nitrite response regulator NarL
VSSQDTCGRIVIVDSDLRMFAAVSGLLRQAGHAVSVATSAADALLAVREEWPRLVLLEVALNGVSGLELCHELREEHGAALPIMFVSDRGADPRERVAGLLVGADDYLTMPFVPDELLARVRALTRRSAPSAAATAVGLTPREREVLELMAGGLGQAEIADRLVVSSKTVGNHIEHILWKLGVHSRAQAVAFAFREHIVL